MILDHLSHFIFLIISPYIINQFNNDQVLILFRMTQAIYSLNEYVHYSYDHIYIIKIH